MTSHAATSRAAESRLPVTAPVPETYAIDKTHSEAAFQVRHLVTKVRGRFRDFEGVVRIDREHPERSTVEFSIEAASVDTDVVDRDTHLKSPDYLRELADRAPRRRSLRRDRYFHAARRRARGDPASDLPRRGA